MCHHSGHLLQYAPDACVEWHTTVLQRSHMPVDEDTRVSLKDLQLQWLKARNKQDYEKLSVIGKDIRTLLGVGNEILRLKRQL